MAGLQVDVRCVVCFAIVVFEFRFNCLPHLFQVLFLSCRHTHLCMHNLKSGLCSLGSRNLVLKLSTLSIHKFVITYTSSFPLPHSS